MAYYIHYSPDTAKRYPPKRQTSTGVGRLLKIGIIITVVVLMVFSYRSGVLREVFIPGDPVITTAAFDNLITSLKEGTGLQVAVQAFCAEIIQNASVS